MAELDLKPHDINKDTWVYEEPRGINVVHQVRSKNGDFIQTEMIRLPWSKLLRFAKRYEARNKAGK